MNIFKNTMIVIILLIQINIFSQQNSEEIIIPDEYKTEILKYFEITEAKNNYIQTIDLLLDSFKKNFKNVPEDIWIKWKFEIEKETQSILDSLIPIYYKYYTLEDIKKINEFYQSDLGKKIIKNSPQVIKESFEIGTEWGNKIKNKILEDLKDKGLLKI